MFIYGTINKNIHLYSNKDRIFGFYREKGNSTMNSLARAFLGRSIGVHNPRHPWFIIKKIKKQ